MTILKKPTQADYDALRLFSEVQHFRRAPCDMQLADYLREWQLGYFVREHPTGYFMYELSEQAIVPVTYPIPHSGNRRIRKAGFSITLNKAFEEVLERCARHRERQVEGFPANKPWIEGRTKAFLLQANSKLHRLCHPYSSVHSLEVWQGDNLVGGTLFMQMGGGIRSLSLFSDADNAGSAACIARQKLLWDGGFVFHDSGTPSNAATFMGGILVPKAEASKARQSALSMQLSLPNIRDKVTLSELLDLKKEQENGRPFPRQECDASKGQDGGQARQNLRQISAGNSSGGQARPS